MDKPKFQEPSLDTQHIFNKVIVATGLSNYMKITILANNTAKQIFKVTKANDLIKFMSGNDVLIIINEVVLDKLTEEQKYLVAEEALAYVSYNMDKDKIFISQPDFVAHSGILRKHSFETIEIVRESVKTLFSTLKQEEEEDVQTT